MTFAEKKLALEFNRSHFENHVIGSESVIWATEKNVVEDIWLKSDGKLNTAFNT